MTSAADLLGSLARAEDQLQDVLAMRPPPFFVQRQLDLAGVPEDGRLAFVKQVFPSAASDPRLEYAVMVDSLAITQRDDVACLNDYFHDDFRARLEQTADDVRGLLAAAESQADAFAAYQARELLGYLLTERYHWSYMTLPVPVWQMFRDQRLLSEAGALLDAAFAVARDRRDWLRWHRITANRARLGYFRREDPPAKLAQEFDGALSLGQLCLDHGLGVDRAFVGRRDDLLHMAAGVKFAAQDVTYPNLSAHIKSPGRIKPPPGGVRLTIESGKAIVNISPPLTMTVGSTTDPARARSLFMDWLSIEDRALVWMAYGGHVQGRSLMYRALHNLDNLDLILRPSLFEVALKPAHAPFAGGPATAGARGDRVAYVGPDPGGAGLPGADSVDGKTWVFRFPTIEVGEDPPGHRHHTERWPDLTGVPWERALGAVLADLLPRNDDNLAHLVLSADGPMALLPLHLARLPDGRRVGDRYRVSYAPSLGYFSPAPPVATGARVAVVLNTRNRLQGPIWELQRLKDRLGEANVRALDGFEGDDGALGAEIGDCDVIHIATHGQTFTDAPDTSGVELRKGRTLTIRAIERLRLKPGCLVFLNACGSNRVTIRSRIQFSSIASAFLAAGAATVVATFWETDDVAAALLSDRFYGHLLDDQRGRLDSLTEAIAWLRTLQPRQLPEATLGRLAAFLPVSRPQPYDSAEHWGQFALFGHW